MTYDQFRDWCNERACDGFWSINTAIFCIGVMKEINSIKGVRRRKKREKAWNKMNKEQKIEELVVDVINAKIDAALKGADNE